MKLNLKQKAFVEAYLSNGQNGKQAAIAAGYSEKTAEVQACVLLRHAKVSEELQKRIGAISKKLEITAERIMQERAKLAFFDPRKLFDDNGEPVHISKLDDDTAAAIAGVDVVTQGNTEVGFATVQKIRLASKDSSLTALEKTLGMYKDKEENQGALNIHIHN